MKNNRIPITDRIPFSLLAVCIFIIVSGAILLSILLKLNTEADYRRYYRQMEVGQIAEQSIYVRAGVDVVDTQATERLRQQASDSVLPVFTFSAYETTGVINSFDSLRTAWLAGDTATVREILGEKNAIALSELTDKSLFAATYEILVHICTAGYYMAEDIARVRNQGKDAFTLSNRYNGETGTEPRVSVDSFIITTSNVTSYILNILSEYAGDISLQDIYIVRDLLEFFLTPNVFYDEILTAERTQKARAGVEPVVLHFNRGDVLLERDRVVTEEQMRQLRLLSSRVNISPEETIADVVFIILSVSLLMVAFVNRVKADYERMKVYVSLLTAFAFISCVIAYFSVSMSIQYFDAVFLEAFLPVILLPVLMTMVTGQRNAGVISSLIVSICMLFIPDMTIMMFFYSFACGTACVFLVRLFNRRLDTILQWITSLFAVLVLDAFFMMRDYGFSTFRITALATGANVTAAILVVSLILPFMERIFKLPTKFRLNELAFTDSPLLKRLAQAAPGTFNHSQNVANIACAAANAIGADAMIAYVGGLYHDIGKTEHPEYFVENQTGSNKHDDINPHLSASIIKNHVKAGAQRGKEFGLPSEIIDIIENHHGDDVISYFYNEARKEQAVNTHDPSVHLEDFKYQARIPSSKECAIVMIADTIEAAARTVTTPTPAKFSKLINQIILGKIERGQLNDSNLTLNEIDVIARSVLKTLTAQYHSRIEYPEEEKDQ